MWRATVPSMIFLSYKKIILKLARHGYSLSAVRYTRGAAYAAEAGCLHPLILRLVSKRAAKILLDRGGLHSYNKQRFF